MSPQWTATPWPWKERGGMGTLLPAIGWLCGGGGRYGNVRDMHWMVVWRGREVWEHYCQPLDGCVEVEESDFNQLNCHNVCEVAIYPALT